MGELIVAKGFEKLPKIQKIAQSGHTGFDAFFIIKICTSEYFTLIIIQKQMIGAHSGFELRTARWSAKIVPEYYIHSHLHSVICTNQRTLNIGECITDLLFDWFGFDQTSKKVIHLTKANKINWRITTVQ